MVCQSVVSSNLARVCYEADQMCLDITFHSGDVYRYSGVPSWVYQGLLNASSKGAYHARYIKNSYPYRRV